MFEDVRYPSVFGFFEEISQIPRDSGNESGIADYLESFAARRGLYCYRDSVNNIFIKKPAVGDGFADHAPVLLQGHTDMVCEATEGTAHDFTRDAIQLIREGDILRADGTTLGADDGCAVALMLALLDSDSLRHPPLECLFTVGEEVGMDGMTAFDTSLIDARRMINLDSAGEGVATVACAGGVRCDFSSQVIQSELPASSDCYILKLSGLCGGHSGEDIALGRANAIELCTTVMRALRSISPVRIIDIFGGSKDNAIPRECTVRFAVSGGADISAAVEASLEFIRHALVSDDASFVSSLTRTSVPAAALTAADSERIIDFLSVFRSGPVSMSPTVTDMVESSYNLASVRISDGLFRAVVSFRSSEEAALDDMTELMHSIGRLAQLDTHCHSRYPGWSFANESPLRELYLSTWRELSGSDGKAIGIHAGLECGLLLQRVPDMDIISIGPDIKDLHSPSETLGIASYDRLCDTVVAMLEHC